MTTPFGKVFFLAACRARDKAILASVAHNGKQIDPTAVKKMLKELDSVRIRPSLIDVQDHSDIIVPLIGIR